MEFNPIKIQKGNDCELRIVPRLQDGTKVPASALSNIVVKFEVAGVQTTQVHTVMNDYICIALTDAMALGTYNVLIHAKIGTRDVEDNRLAVFQRVAWGNGISYEHYTTEFVIVATSDADLEALKAQLTAAIAAAQTAQAQAAAAKAAYIAKAEELDDIASETQATANKNTLLAAIANIDAKLQEATDAEIDNVIGGLN